MDKSRGITHSEHCYEIHHGCAVARVHDLAARLADVQGMLDEAQKIVTGCLDERERDKARLAEAERHLNDYWCGATEFTEYVREMRRMLPVHDGRPADSASTGESESHG